MSAQHKKRERKSCEELALPVVLSGLLKWDRVDQRGNGHMLEIDSRGGHTPVHPQPARNKKDVIGSFFILIFLTSSFILRVYLIVAPSAACEGVAVSRV